MNELSIHLENVNKRYALGEKGYRSLRESIISVFKGKKEKKEILWALDNVSFDVKKGEVVGVIGPNGAGKSTLLKLLAKVAVPTSGKVITNGRIGALIELAAGFHHELTGRENIYLYGSIMGMKRSEINEKFSEIVAFSGLEKFLDTPVKKYSSGMKARLGFSVSIHIDPDILLIDEVLSVGDYAFQEKCLEKMEQYKERGVTILFVSHNMDSVRKLCKRTLLLRRGRVVQDGDTAAAIDKYFDIVSTERKTLTFVDETGEKKERVKIHDIQLLNTDNKATSHFYAGETAVLRYTAKFAGDAKVFFNFLVWRNDRLLVYDTSQYLLQKQYVEGHAGSCIRVEFKFKVNLLKGVYSIGTHITDYESNVYLDVVDNAGYLFVVEDFSYGGVADLRAEAAVIPINYGQKMVIMQK
jgi:lipopolysaccharide transport system ATP-binding protein